MLRSQFKVKKKDQKKMSASIVKYSGYFKSKKKKTFLKNLKHVKHIKGNEEAQENQPF